MVWLQVEELPQRSVARQVRTTIKFGPQPAFVTVLTIVMVTLVPLARSVALGGSNDQELVQMTPLSGAQMKIGGVASTTLTVWLHVARLVQLSVACQTRVAVKVLPQKPAVLV